MGIREQLNQPSTTPYPNSIQTIPLDDAAGTLTNCTILPTARRHSHLGASSFARLTNTADALVTFDGARSISAAAQSLCPLMPASGIDQAAPDREPPIDPQPFAPGQ